MFKRLIFVLLPLVAILFVSCENEDQAENELTDEAFIEALVTDPAAEEVSALSLPPETEEAISAQHFETYVETVYRVPNRGFIIELGSGEVLYARLNGSLVRYAASFRPGGVFSDHPHGRCFRRLRTFGRLLDTTEISPTILDYLSINYPDRPIVGAKERGDSTLVGIRPATVLLFGADDAFLNEWNVLENCRDRCAPVRPALQTTIEDYISANYPDVEIRRTCGRLQRVTVLVADDDGRRILIFDREGNFLGERG